MGDHVTRDELAIIRTLAEYCMRCDDGDFASLVDLFTADGALGYSESEARGRAALLAFFESSQGLPEQRGKHITANFVIDLDGDGATARSDFVFYRFVDGVFTPAIGGRYHDELVRDDGQWRFARREIRRMIPPAS
jgi:hypothetical protein